LGQADAGQKGRQTQLNFGTLREKTLNKIEKRKVGECNVS